MVERIISINDEIILKNYDKIKIRAISENSIFESSDYSEVKTYLYSDFGLTQLTIPTISINYDYEITFNEHSDTNSFSISINNKEEVIVKSNEKVTVKIGDTIKIKSVAEKDNQVDSEYKTYYISEIRTYSVPRIQYSHYEDKKFSYSFETNELAQYRSDKIWLKLNDEILATTIDDLEKISFKTGDKISIKFRTDAPLSYFENEEILTEIIFKVKKIIELVKNVYIEVCNLDSEMFNQYCELLYNISFLEDLLIYLECNNNEKDKYEQELNELKHILYNKEEITNEFNEYLKNRIEKITNEQESFCASIFSTISTFPAGSN